jgi:hypothetical protein
MDSALTRIRKMMDGAKSFDVGSPPMKLMVGMV